MRIYFQIIFSMLALINLVPTGMTVGYSAIALPNLNNIMDISLTDQESTLFGKNLFLECSEFKNKEKDWLNVIIYSINPINIYAIWLHNKHLHPDPWKKTSNFYRKFNKRFRMDAHSFELQCASIIDRQSSCRYVHTYIF